MRALNQIFIHGYFPPHLQGLLLLHPLRLALDNVGECYKTAEPWRLDPANSSSVEISCRPSFSILMTDGYWTGGTAYEASTSSTRGNTDSTNGSAIATNSQTFTYTATGTFSDSWSKHAGGCRYVLLEA